MPLLSTTPTPRARLLALARRLCLPAALAAALAPAHAGMALTTLPGRDGDGPVTLFHPTDAPERALPIGRDWYTLSAAPDGVPRRGNGRLVVVSHGSGGGPWVHTDLARRLVAAGFVVAFASHAGDRSGDDADAGPVSWARRPAEVSRAIDAVAADPRFAPLLALDRVGVWGQSAGGHTALSMAGGRWSPARFRDHCRAHIGEDFNACVGLATRLSGGWADGLKRWLALRVLGLAFGDPTEHAHDDPRVAAVVAGNPAAADFDPDSLARPRVPLGLVSTRLDRWLHARFHVDRILAACRPRCEHLADLADGGHGALLAPLPPRMDGLLQDLLGDPPGFDRAALAALDARVVDFFLRHLTGGRSGSSAFAP